MDINPWIYVDLSCNRILWIFHSIPAHWDENLINENQFIAQLPCNLFFSIYDAMTVCLYKTLVLIPRSCWMWGDDRVSSPLLLQDILAIVIPSFVSVRGNCPPLFLCGRYFSPSSWRKNSPTWRVGAQHQEEPSAKICSRAKRKK